MSNRFLKRYFGILLAFFSMALLAACDNNPSDPDTPQGTDTSPGMLILSKDTVRPGKTLYSICRMNADGSNHRLIRTLPDFDYARTVDYISISPDNENGFIAVTGACYLLNLKAGNPIRLGTMTNGHAWSPDGKRLVFTEYGMSPDWSKVYIVNSDGSGKRLLKDNAWVSNWLPDNRIVMSYNSRAYSIRPDGSDFKPAAAGFGLLSPQGDRLAYEYEEGFNSRSICVVNVDGTNLKKMVTIPWDQGQYMISGWSPDGKKLVLWTMKMGWDIYQLDVENGFMSPLIRTDDSAELYPSWSPDGNLIAYTMLYDTEPSAGVIATIRPDGAGNKILTPSNRYDVFLKWVK